MAASASRGQKAAPKRRATPRKQAAKSKDAVQSSALDLFNDVEKSDLQFLIKGFEQNYSLVPWLASLMRDGILDKNLRMKQVGAQHIELGKKLPVKCRRLRNLPPRFWNLLWLNLWKVAPSEKKGDKLSLEQHLGLAQWALRLTEDAELPTRHKSSQYEGPLLAVMKARHESLGGRLQDFTPDAFKNGGYGYFTLPVPFKGQVKLTNGATVEVISEAQAATATDWEIHEGYNLDAALVSVSLQFSQGLFCIARRTLKEADLNSAFAPHDQSFEMPNAADMFPDPKGYEAPSGSGAASSASEARASSSASSMCASLGTSVGGVIVTPIKPRRQLED